MVIWLQHIVPKRLLTRLVGFFARARLGRLTQACIRWFVQHYHVDMSQAKEPDCTRYASFDEFFTRPLCQGARPVDANDKVICSPADGCISAFGQINEGALLQAKGHTYQLVDLVGGSNSLARPYERGQFMTIYLSPRDYHRVHMPFSGRLVDMVYVPGDLFSVNEAAVQGVRGLFARNERVVCIFETDIGKMAVILVGAMIVGQIELDWYGSINANHQSVMELWHYHHQDVHYQKGDEIGMFHMGSTVIMLFEHRDLSFSKASQLGASVLMGQGIARV